MNNPEAYIAKNKSRIRVYNQNIVYLNDGDEFQLEFFNPTNKSILAKFSFNGLNNSSGMGLVIRPGERVFLDRYLDKIKKFKFTTYDVENTSESKQAIQNNGKVNISFFNEKNPNHFISYNQPAYYTYPPNNIYYTSNYTTDNNVGVFSMSTNYIDTELCSQQDIKSCVEPKLTTGRVETGNISNQKLTDVNMDFDVFSFYNVDYQIKPIENKTIFETPIYCTHCGYRRRKLQWKVCPICGEKFEF